MSTLENVVEAQRVKLEEVEKVAKRKGMIAQMVMQYGAPFAIWYATLWAGSWFGIYMLLEMEVISWQESLRPLFEGMGLDSYTDKIDPSMGSIVIAFMANELLEPIRFPLVLATGKPVIEAIRRMRGKAPISM